MQLRGAPIPYVACGSQVEARISDFLKARRTAPWRGFRSALVLTASEALPLTEDLQKALDRVLVENAPCPVPRCRQYSCIREQDPLGVRPLPFGEQPQRHTRAGVW